jgi:alkylation response protein AidB-like acyl-CoA dehydrogenase
VDFRDDAEQAAFRAELRSWLRTNVPSSPSSPPLRGPARAHHAHRWHSALYEAGWMGLSWPTRYGGRGLADSYEAIFNDELGMAGAPPAPHVGFLGRALLHFGTEEQRTRFLPGLLSGDEVWCQGFSEPAAGSDLANVSTRATPTSDGYVVNGQKIWTSDAAWANWCLLLARTDVDAPRHRGISALLVDMTTPGIEVRPIVQINGDEEFNEVFFSDVDVPGSAVLGEPGDGWAIAMTTVSYERGPTDVGFSSRYVRTLRHLTELASGPGTTDAQRVAVARAHVELEVLRAHLLRSLCAREGGRSPGHEGSIDKLLGTRVEQRLHHVSMDLQVDALTGDAPEVLSDYLYSRAASIAGGTSQIQRSLIAEHLLGMPRVR